MTAEKKEQLVKKLENIWFYYKWYIIILGLLGAFTVYACAQCSSRVEADMTILFVTGKDNSSFTDATCKEIKAYIGREYFSDVNGDGEENIEYYHFQVSDSVKTTDTTVQQALTMSIIDKSSFLIICDDAGYEHLNAIGSEETPVDVLEPLNEIGAVDGYRISLAGTALGNLPTINEMGDEEELFLCLRAYTNTSAEKDKAATKRYETARDTFMQIIYDKKEE